MTKVGVEKVPFSQNGDGFDSYNTRPAVNQGGWVQPSAPPITDNNSTIVHQPMPQQQPGFLPMPEPGPIYQPQSQFQPQSSPYNSAPKPAFLPMPEPEPVRQPQPPHPPIYQPSASSSQIREAPPGYYESVLAQDPLNRFRTDIFTSMNTLLTLKAQVLERESHLNEFQRRSELLGGAFQVDHQVLYQFEAQMNNLHSCVRAAQQHLKESGEKETLVSGTNRKKMKIHIEGCGCCGADSHFYRDLCDQKPKVHVEGMCVSPDVFVQTCEQQNNHTGWIWGKQKVVVEGMWTSPKVHLKGLLINPVIHVSGMWSKPEIHLEGICLRPEVHVEGVGANPTVRITGLCDHLKIHLEGMCCRANVNIIGICQQVETSKEGGTGVYLSVTGVCKNLKRSFGSFSPSVKFKGNDMEIRVWPFLS